MNNTTPGYGEASLMSTELLLPPRVTPCFAEDADERRALTALFDSTGLTDHMEARRLCRRCPFVAGCRKLADELAAEPAASWADTPSGTWGGQLYIRGNRVERRGALL